MQMGNSIRYDVFSLRVNYKLLHENLQECGAIYFDNDFTQSNVVYR